MVKLSTLRAAPLAFAHWLGVAGRNDVPMARIVLFHGTPRSNAASLERQLRWIKQRFHVVPLRSLIAAAANGDAALGRKVALTFDDGLRSNVEIAYPILQRLALPATFFICPGLIDRGAWLWNHEARRRFAHLAPGARRELAREWHAHEVEDFVEWMKTQPLDARQRVEARLREATPQFSPSAQEREECDLAGWEELRRLDPAVVAIGSHTMTHTILPVAPPAEMETEVRDSRRVLERGLERPIDLFAYPNGDLNDAVEACVRKHYRAAVTSARGWVRRGADAHCLPRLAAPRGVLRLARRLYP